MARFRDTGRLEAIGRRLGLAPPPAAAARVLELGRDLQVIGAGRFDYIIADRVYSWVAAPAREALLALIKQRLAPQGVALVSHNVKPGWGLRALARELARFAQRDGADAARGRAFLELIAAGARAEDRRYRALLAAELERGADLDDLGDGCWLHELAARLDGHGLAYLADAETADAPGAGDPVAREQYADFRGNRGFRMTVVGHAGAAVTPRSP